ncbi:MAG: mechanosensitive ion channel domain-containing protein [Desulfuromonadales bacterium]
MVLDFTTRLERACALLVMLLAMAGLSTTPAALAQKDTLEQEKPQQEQPQEKVFPGLNEVVPQGTALATKLGVAKTQIQGMEDRQDLYDTLDALLEDHAKLEEQYQDWENITDWQINRLLIAQTSYSELADLLNSQLKVINRQLQGLENQRVTWAQEKSYWQEWQGYLRQAGVRIPEQQFKSALNGIDDQLQNIARISSELVRAQQKYAPAQQGLASRLGSIKKAIDNLRMDTFRRNARKMFEADYYRQFDSELWTEFTDSLAISLSLPDNLVQRHGDVIGLYLFSFIIITLLFVYRSRKSRPVREEWVFLFKRPVASATFISIAVIGLFSDLNINLPLLWKWLLFMLIIIAAMRLLNAFSASPGVKKAIRTIAVVAILTESLRYFGLPTPLMQLYNTLLCAIAIPVCWQRIQKPEGKELLAKQRAWARLLLGVALIGLFASVLGFENLTTSLIDSTLTTFIVLILMKMALLLSERGADTLMQTEWIKERHFMQVLGVADVTGKLQMLFKIIIIVNTAIFMLVTWKLFDNSAEARNAILGFEYTFGEFSISIQMVVLVVVVLYLTTIISWVIQAFVDSQIMTPRKMDLGVKESLKRLTHYGLFTIGFLIAVSMAGLGLQNFSIIVGALGVGIGFGLQNIVNNFVSGLILLFERPVKVGDVINIDQDWGTITRIGLRSTVFETFDRSEIIVPNADLISQKVTNWTFSSKIVRVVLPVGVAYGSPLDKVLEILARAAKENPDVLSYPAPSPIFIGFGNSSIDFELRVWITTIDDRLKIRSELGVIIDRLFREEGIEIPFPQRDLHLRSIDSNLQSLFGAKPERTETDNQETPE